MHLFGFPAKGFGEAVVGLDEPINAGAKLLDGSEAGALEGGATEDAEPNFYLIEPARVGGGEMEMDAGVAAEPKVMLGLVSTEVVEDDMDFLVGVSSHDLVHKGQELLAPLPLSLHASDPARSHFQSSKQSAGPVPLVFMALATDCPAVGQPQVALRPFQSLDAGLLIHAKNNRVLRRIQIETNYLRGLRGKFRVRANAPASAPLELNAVAAQEAPHLIRGNILQGLSEQGPVPRGISLRRWLIQFGEDALLYLRAVLPRSAHSLLILERGDAARGKAHSPGADGVQPDTLTSSDTGRAFALCRSQDDAGPKSQTLLSRWRAQPAFEFTMSFIRKDNRRCNSTHAASILQSALIFSSKY
jgi:hypothetical protein